MLIDVDYFENTKSRSFDNINLVGLCIQFYFLGLFREILDGFLFHGFSFQGASFLEPVVFIYSTNHTNYHMCDT